MPEDIINFKFIYDISKFSGEEITVDLLQTLVVMINNRYDDRTGGYKFGTSVGSSPKYDTVEKIKKLIKEYEFSFEETVESARQRVPGVYVGEDLQDNETMPIQ